MKTLIANARGLIFDCDGTLADTMPLHWQAWLECFSEIGLSCTPDFLGQFCGVPSRVIVETYNTEFGTALDPIGFSAIKQARVQQLLPGASPIEAITSVVNASLGVLPMAVASGGTRKNVDMILNAIGLDQAFDVILTADDAVDAKPLPGIFLEAARLLKIPPQECLVFEDGEPGFIAARRAGIPFVDVRQVIV